jgi:DNA-binding response OmpR family regulator
MSLKVVLAIGVDPSLLEIRSSDWRSSGYIVTFAWSIKDAIAHFRYGDFDLVLLGNTLPAESRERLTFLIRASGSQVPVARIADTSSDSGRPQDLTLSVNATHLLEEIEELMASRATTPMSRSNTPLSVNWQATAR